MNQVTEKVYFDVSINGHSTGRIVFGMFGEDSPKAVENFVKLSTRNAKQTKPTGFFKSTFHRVVKQFLIQGGDWTKGDGTGGLSIWGKPFEDEDLKTKHFPGCLAMANSGKDSNTSQFYITTVETPWLNGKCVVFGKVVEGMDVVMRLEQVPVDLQNKPQKRIQIDDCGLI